MTEAQLVDAILQASDHAGNNVRAFLESISDLIGKSGLPEDIVQAAKREASRRLHLRRLGQPELCVADRA